MEYLWCTHYSWVSWHSSFFFSVIHSSRSPCSSALAHLSIDAYLCELCVIVMWMPYACVKHQGTDMTKNIRKILSFVPPMTRRISWNVSDSAFFPLLPLHLAVIFFRYCSWENEVKRRDLVDLPTDVRLVWARQRLANERMRTFLQITNDFKWYTPPRTHQCPTAHAKLRMHHLNDLFLGLPHRTSGHLTRQWALRNVKNKCKNITIDRGDGFLSPQAIGCVSSHFVSYILTYTRTTLGVVAVSCIRQNGQSSVLIRVSWCNERINYSIFTWAL